MSRDAFSRIADRRPVRLLSWEDAAEGRVAVLRPKYGTGRWGRWLSLRLARPYCRVELDDRGSFVWKQCDGRRTPREIAIALRDRAGEPETDLQDRLALFLDQLQRQGMIGWIEDRAADGDVAPSGPAGSTC